MFIQGGLARVHAEATAYRQLPPEIAFLLRHGVPRPALEDATVLAAEGGVSADEALIRSGRISEECYFRLLAAELDLPFIDGLLDVHCRARFPEAILAGLVPLGPAAAAQYAYAPRGEVVAGLLVRRIRLAGGIAITTPASIRRSVIAARGEQVAALAANGLAHHSPRFSYRGGANRRQFAVGYVFGFASGASAVLAPEATWTTASLLLGVAFLGSTSLRLASVLEPVPVSPPRLPPRTADRDLPVYTILVALYREARVLPRLLTALEAIDYPAAKLDAKLIVEADDRETAAALAGARLPGFVEVITAPPGEPRTKPRALNVALPLARGEFVTVYDAEDVPDPDQLRLAVSVFERSAPEVACLQARLVIDNTRDSWLTRMFTIEYAALFDVLSPALARFDLPVLLGGTSNHFRRPVLQALGGWDAWNVTEDADLGIRLAAAGYRVADLPSATREEAPAHLGAWLRQRTRWMKGLLQVSVTHSRSPAALFRELGTARALGALALTFGSVASAAGFPFLMVLAFDAVLTGRLFQPQSLLDITAAAVGSTLFAAGLLALTLPPIEALRRRRWPGLLAHVALMPAYYCLVSIAAWRGLLEFVLQPQRWNKTEHGLSRTTGGAGLTG